MAEAAVHYYDTEIEWKGEKDLRLGADKLPVINAGAPPEFKARRPMGRRNISLLLR
jgi:hypothetical protein